MFDKYDTMGAYHWRECDRSSKEYNPPLAARYEIVLKYVPKGKVLDVGAGDGYLAGRLAGQCSEVIGLEYEPTGVKIAQGMLASHANVTIRQGDAYQIPFEDSTFEGLVMADVIEHLDHPEKAVAEMARVTAENGVALITTPHWRSDRVWDHRHVKEYTADELRTLMETGFQDVKLVFCWPRKWSDLYRTRIGWRVLRILGRMGFNPFQNQSDTADGYCQILAICRQPRRSVQ